MSGMEQRLLRWPSTLNRTLLDMVRSMMSQTDLPLYFWGYALKTAAFTLYRVPSKSVEKTPYEIWTGKRPSLSFLTLLHKIFCEAFWNRPRRRVGF
jgi:hypothetical protein